MDRPNLNEFRESEADRNEIARFVRLLFLWFVLEAGIVEVRAKGTPKGIVSGYFDSDHQNELVEAAAYWSGLGEAVWFSANPVNRDVHGRACNRMKPYAKVATKKEEIACRRMLFIDFDSMKPKGVSATDAELTATIEAGKACCDWLSGLGWPKPIIAMSGNGCHLYYRIELPNDDDATTLVNAVLTTIKAHCGSAAVEFDAGVGDAARMCKLPGTKACKGDEMPDRPHRMAKLIDVPDEIKTLSRDQLESLATSVGSPASVNPASAHPTNGQMPYGLRMNTFDLEAWLRQNNVAVKQVKTWEGGTLHELERCPFKPPETKTGGARIIQFPDGHVVAGCFHPGCLEKGWPEFRAALAPNEETDPTDSQNQASDDPHQLARVYRDSRCFHPDRCTLVRWRGGWWRWRKSAWRLVNEEELEADVLLSIKEQFDRIAATGKKAPKLTVSVVRNVTMNLRSLVRISDEIEQPAWLNDDAPWPAEETISAANGLIHLPSLADGTDYLREATPNFFTTSAVDFSVDANAPKAELWESLLGQYWGDDEKSIRLLQEWFGYILTADTRYQKILMIVGPTRSGKGTMTKVMELLVGPDNACSPSLSDFRKNFGLASLIGKSIATVNDARIDGRHDTSEIVEKLLNISGEDSVTIDRKNQSAVIGKLSTRLTICSNEEQRFVDASGALANRMLILKMTKSFLDNEDATLLKRLSKELPGIFLWAIRGRKRLRERGRFDPPESSREAVREMADGGSPVRAFVRDCCRVEAGLSVPKADLFDAFKTWCELRGITNAGSDLTFAKNLHAVVSTLGTKQETRDDGKKHRLHVGIGLHPATEWGHVND